MKRLPKMKGMEEALALTAKQKEATAQFSKHSKLSLAIALAVVTSRFTKGEIDHVLGLLTSVDAVSKAERDYKTLRRYGAAL